jgi:Carboxypeptidase regulatory-like domain
MHLIIRKSFALILALCALPMFAQDPRGSITGRVIDQQSGVIPSAAVEIVNVDTNVKSSTATNSTGYFEVDQLNPGMYAVTISAAGFRTAVRKNVTLNVGGRLGLDFKMEIGETVQQVEVTAANPLLETTSASGGQVIESRAVQDLPFFQGNPFALLVLTAGMQNSGNIALQQPYQPWETAKFSAAGGVGGNNYAVDGVPVTASVRGVGFVPPPDAVSEFRVETTSFDASVGFSSGASINVTTKAGTNQLHGSAFEQHREQRWNATPHFTRLAYDAGVAAGKIAPGTEKQGSGRFNNYGFTVGGPVYIPKVYNGRDKLFFMLSFNRTNEQDAAGTNKTVPQTAWRTGDFSDVLKFDATR